MPYYPQTRRPTPLLDRIHAAAGAPLPAPVSPRRSLVERFIAWATR
jgi:hypothetical protein